MIHNSMIRGLNSIYVQAPHVLPADHADFIEYSRCWAELVIGHHDVEETVFFPNIEKSIGIKGLMDANIEQHRMFYFPLPTISHTHFSYSKTNQINKNRRSFP